MGVSKRVVDVICGTALALVCLPLMAIAALVSAVSLRAWPLFVQQRVGKDGRLFEMIKIRTLPTTTPRYASKYELGEVNVPRTTTWLRRLHLDELPQLMLVPLGRMSLVGPRPEMPMLNEEFDDTTAALRTSVRPGCTGLWQVSPRSEGLIPEAPEFDRFYLAQRNLRLDLWILWRTFCLMVLRRPPVPLSEIPAWALRRRPMALRSISLDSAPLSGTGGHLTNGRGSLVEVVGEAGTSD